MLIDSCLYYQALSVLEKGHAAEYPNKRTFTSAFSSAQAAIQGMLVSSLPFRNSNRVIIAMQAVIDYPNARGCLQRATDVVKDHGALDEEGFKIRLQESGHSLSQSVACIGYLLDHYHAIMALHDKIIAEIRLASPSNIPTVKIPSNSVQPEPSEAPEAIEG